MANPANDYARRSAFPGETPVAVRRHTLGEWIRTTRIAHGMSQRALAERAGVSRSYLCDIERGRGAQPTVTTLDKLARALGASRIDLLRVAGILEPAGSRAGDDRERRLLSCFRGLSLDSQAAVERFAQFLRAEEHRWVQPRLLDGEEDERLPKGPPMSGPTLFDELEHGSEIRR